MVEPPTENHLVLRFEIIDTGIGMDQETADKLFTPFTQADNTTTREFGGTGLGLSISHRLVNLMDGKIGVDSAPGKGSKFWVEIPTTESSMNIYDDLPDLDGIAVLSVEDHPAGAKEINRTLTSMGAKVETANTFSDGLKLITKRPYDVAVIDHGLPDGDGLDLLRQTSDLRPFTGLVLYTVHDSQLIQQTTKSLGATYLSKPASRIGLGKAVKQAARQRVSPKFSGPRRLLLAEDNDTVRDVLGQQLDQFGITVDFADNGVEALSMLEDDEYGILMTDLHMPKMDGYGLVKKIRAEEEKQNLPHRPVIAITADVQLMQNQRYLSHGFDECLLKPVTIGQLQRLLMRWGIITDQKTKNKRLNNKDQKNDPGISDKKTILDRQAIARQFGGMNDMTINILQKFVDLAGQQIDDLQDGINNKEIDRVAEIAHSLKGGAHSAGAVMVGDLAAEVQKLAEKTDDPDIQKMIGVLMVLKDAYRTVSDEIDGLSSN
jgi:CheY-like chemotaxis protein